MPRSMEEIKSLKEDIFSLSDADRDTTAKILYIMDPSVRANSTDIDNVGVDLQEISDATFQALQQFVNGCLLKMRKT